MVDVVVAGKITPAAFRALLGKPKKGAAYKAVETTTLKGWKVTKLQGAKLLKKSQH